MNYAITYLHLFVAVVVGQPVLVGFLSSVVACEPTVFTWDGGKAPYFLRIVTVHGDPSTLKHLGQQANTSYTWRIDTFLTDPVALAVEDSTGEITTSRPFRISTDCNSKPSPPSLKFPRRPLLPLSNGESCNDNPSTISIAASVSPGKSATTIPAGCTSKPTATSDFTVTNIGTFPSLTLSSSTSLPTVTTSPGLSPQSRDVRAAIGLNASAIAMFFICIAISMKYLHWRSHSNPGPVTAHMQTASSFPNNRLGVSPEPQGTSFIPLESLGSNNQPSHNSAGFSVGTQVDARGSSMQDIGRDLYNYTTGSIHYNINIHTGGAGSVHKNSGGVNPVQCPGDP